jgi:hypothetical protein
VTKEPLHHAPKAYSFEAAGIPDLLEKFMAVRKAFTGPNHPRNLMVVLDHVEARVVERAEGRLTLEISNPTGFDARVSVLVEDGAAARRPLGVTAFLG